MQTKQELETKLLLLYAEQTSQAIMALFVFFLLAIGPFVVVSAFVSIGVLPVTIWQKMNTPSVVSAFIGFLYMMFTSSACIRRAKVISDTRRTLQNKDTNA